MNALGGFMKISGLLGTASRKEHLRTDQEKKVSTLPSSLACSLKTRSKVEMNEKWRLSTYSCVRCRWSFYKSFGNSSANSPYRCAWPSRSKSKSMMYLGFCSSSSLDRDIFTHGRMWLINRMEQLTHRIDVFFFFFVVVERFIRTLVGGLVIQS